VSLGGTVPEKPLGRDKSSHAGGSDPSAKNTSVLAKRQVSHTEVVPGVPIFLLQSGSPRTIDVSIAGCITLTNMFQACLLGKSSASDLTTFVLQKLSAKAGLALAKFNTRAKVNGNRPTNFDLLVINGPIIEDLHYF
jgi:hypothetical protein